MPPTIPPARPASLPSLPPSQSLRPRSARAWDRQRALEVLAREARELRLRPGPLARLHLEIDRALGLDPTDLPALDQALCTASIEEAEETQALAVFHQDDTLVAMERLLREKTEAFGAEVVAIATLKAEIRLRKASLTDRG